MYSQKTRSYFQIHICMVCLTLNIIQFLSYKQGGIVRTWTWKSRNKKYCSHIVLLLWKSEMSQPFLELKWNFGFLGQLNSEFNLNPPLPPPHNGHTFVMTFHHLISLARWPSAINYISQFKIIQLIYPHQNNTVL